MFAGHIMFAGRWVREHTPGFFAVFRPRLNFITLHCTSDGRSKGGLG